MWVLEGGGVKGPRRRLRVLPEMMDLLQDGHRKGSSTAADAQSMECASAVAALSAVTSGLGAFLAPQLPRMLRVLLDGRGLADSANGIAASAAAARETLTKAVPPRLLLPPLYAHLPSALQVYYCPVVPSQLRAACILCPGAAHSQGQKLIPHSFVEIGCSP